VQNRRLGGRLEFHPARDKKTERTPTDGPGALPRPCSRNTFRAFRHTMFSITGITGMAAPDNRKKATEGGFREQSSAHHGPCPVLRVGFGVRQPRHMPRRADRAGSRTELWWVSAPGSMPSRQVSTGNNKATRKNRQRRSRIMVAELAKRRKLVPGRKGRRNKGRFMNIWGHLRSPQSPSHIGASPSLFITRRPKRHGA